MVFRTIFHSIYPQPDSVSAESRKATLYLLRCVFLMGLRRLLSDQFCAPTARSPGFCDTLRPMIGGTIFVQLLVVGLVLGLTIINIVIFSDIGSRISAMSFMIGVLLEATLFCILCDYLADDCNKLADALFESNWIDQEQRYRKTLLKFLQSLQ
ncbi:GH21469 [Drosophila grimshawi]|uniref:GH21469 n=1 Tax=Drosophila grimshawi TaxID=7222 RepID=B4J9T4_DROGR|nr:GH21469 [Drosophila grimshawi]